MAKKRSIENSKSHKIQRKTIRKTKINPSADTRSILYDTRVSRYSWTNLSGTTTSGRVSLWSDCISGDVSSTRTPITRQRYTMILALSAQATISNTRLHTVVMSPPSARAKNNRESTWKYIANNDTRIHICVDAPTCRYSPRIIHTQRRILYPQRASRVRSQRSGFVSFLISREMYMIHGAEATKARVNRSGHVSGERTKKYFDKRSTISDVMQNAHENNIVFDYCNIFYQKSIKSQFLHRKDTDMERKYCMIQSFCYTMGTFFAYYA